MEEYLKNVLDQIRCKKCKPYIRQELQNHIEDQIEANRLDGMDEQSAEKAAVRDMGDPIDTGNALNRIHKPQIAWKLLLVIALISVFGIFIHMAIARYTDRGEGVISEQHIVNVMIGILMMMILYFLDYTLLAKWSKLIAVMMLCISIGIESSTYYIALGVQTFSIKSLMLFYVPIYGGILYQYRGSGYRGLGKCMVWMMIPVILMLQQPNVMTAALMLISMLVMVTIAIQKSWFMVSKKNSIIGMWGIFTLVPVATFFLMYFGNIMTAYQKERAEALISNSEGKSYMTATLRTLLESNQWLGNSGVEVSEILPGFNSDYVLSYLAATYGIIVAILLCSLLAVFLLFLFSAVMKQKNQLGMIMGCGCGMISLGSIFINILQNLGLLPPMETFLPFLSAGGSYLVVSYSLLGIVLSIYRYKNIYPTHVTIKMPKIKIVFEKNN